MIKNVNLELREAGSNTYTTASIKKSNRCRSFHFRYLELCRAKNLTPLGEIRNKSNANTILDFFGDKLNVTDWLLIVEALYYDQVLQNLGIHMRKTYAMGLYQSLSLLLLFTIILIEMLMKCIIILLNVGKKKTKYWSI